MPRVISSLVFLVAAAPCPAAGPPVRELQLGYTELRTNLPGGRHANVRTMRAAIVRADGSGRRLLAEELTREAGAWSSFAGWSPDGTLAILNRGWQSADSAKWEEAHKQFRFRQGDWLHDAYLLDLAAGKVTNLTAVQRVSFYNSGLFFWAGDATKLGFTALIDGQSHPFRMDRDGRNKVNLTRGQKQFTYGFSSSPDGKRIAYHKDYQVYLADADGSNATRIQTGKPFNFVPAWSPDGKWVLFLAGAHYDCHPHLVRADGTGLRKLADRGGYRGVIEFLDVYDFHGGSSDTPVWSADGRSAFYTARVGKSVELFQVSLDGKATALTRSPAGSLHYHPRPSPDGKLLAYGSLRDGVRQLYLMRLADRREMRLTNLKRGHAAMWPHWQPVAAGVAGEKALVGRWALARDGNDVSGNRLHAVNRGVKFVGGAGRFDGSAQLEVKSTPALGLGTGDFTLTLWLRADKVKDEGGDLVTLYNAKKRVGLNLSLRTNTGVTSSQANVRQLQFGIDSASAPKWVDEGRPGDAVLAFALAVHDGHLYAGTAANGKGVGRVYRYGGPGKWVDCGAPDQCNAISALAAHEGKLYAASSKYRFAGSALEESLNPHLGGRIFRYEGGTKWKEVGRLPKTEAVGGMVVYQGRLYATSLYKPAGFFRYEADGRWTALKVPDGKRVEALAVFGGQLWATSYDGGRVYRYDGKAWKDLGQLGDNTQTYSFAPHRGRLCVGTWPSGKVYRRKGEEWKDIGRLGQELEVMGMLVHNGQLYAGTLPSAEVYRYDGGTTWTKAAQLDRTPRVKYRRAWTMAQYQGRLFCSTLPSGHVHSLQAGPCVTHDHELAAGWRHVAAVKEGGRLRLLVDGKQVAESAPFDAKKFDLTTDVPLRIGAGEADSFRGEMRDVRLYRRALSAAEVEKLRNAGK